MDTTASIRIPFGLGLGTCDSHFITDALAEIRSRGAKGISIHGSACPTPIFHPQTKERHQTNLALALHRAEYVAQELIKVGYPESLIEVATASPPRAMETSAYENARAVFIVPLPITPRT